MAAAWSSRSPRCVTWPRVSCAHSRSCASSSTASAPSRPAARSRGRRGAPCAWAWATRRSSADSCAAVAYRVVPGRELAFLCVHLDGAGGVGVHLRLADAADLVAATVRARDPRHAELARQLTLHRRGGDRLQRAEDGADAHGVQGTPSAVAEGPGDPGDLVVDVVLGVAVPASALQPGGDDQPGGRGCP